MNKRVAVGLSLGAFLTVVVIGTFIIYLAVINFTPDEHYDCGCILQLTEHQNGVAQARFGQFSQNTTANIIEIQIHNGSWTGNSSALPTSVYRFNSTYGEDGAWTTTADDANTGIVLPFTDLDDDGIVDRGEFFVFHISLGQNYEVRMLIGGDEIGSGYLST